MFESFARATDLSKLFVFKLRKATRSGQSYDHPSAAAIACLGCGCARVERKRPKHVSLASWSIGMILAPRARGPGLNSWSSPDGML